MALLNLLQDRCNLLVMLYTSKTLLALLPFLDIQHMQCHKCSEHEEKQSR
jgi:hypothetical protein